MKILAIRGKNLASLAHAFEVDFCREPLASCGIFAITGSTGAGKSTLLDALCLALYDDTPRLLRATAKGINLPDVAGETIAPRDPRTLLRRGAAEGFAEVDFVGNDQIAYRSRWSVRRARSKSGGKLQAVEMLLLRLPDLLPVGGKLKSEILPAIEARIGLTFPQFTRAVLLAQNEFAAFLKAPDDERAELLQTLTGTDQFTRLSVQAFLRAKQEREQLHRLQDQLSGLQPLATAERAALEQQLDTRRTEWQMLEQQQRRLASHLRWHETWEQCQQAVGDAQTGLQQAVDDKVAAAERLTYFHQVEAVQAARPKLDTLDRLNAEREVSQAAIKQADVALEQASHTLAQVSTDLQRADQQCKQAEQAQMAAQPDLQQAKTLDTLIMASLPAREAAQQSLDAAQASVVQASQKQQAYETELQQALATLNNTRAWLEAQAQYRLLGENWSRWETLLTQAATAWQSLADTEQQLGAVQVAVEHKRQASVLAQNRQTRSAEALIPAQTALAVASARYTGFNPEDLAARKHALEQQKQVFADAIQHWQAFNTIKTQHAQAFERVQTLAAQIAEIQSLLVVATTQFPLLEQALLQAERSLQLAALACHENAETLRSTLKPDEPCPVCGATEHPYARLHPQLHAVLDSLRAEAERCRHERNVVQAHMLEQQAQRGATQTRLAATEQELAALASDISTLNSRWQSHPVMAVVTGKQPEDWSAWLNAQQTLIQQALTELVEDERALRTAIRERDAAQNLVDQASSEHQEASHALNMALLAQQQSEQAQQALLNTRSGQDTQLQTLLVALDTAFPDATWQQEWLRNPAAFQQAQQAIAALWVHQQHAAVTLQHQIATLTVECKALSEAQAQAHMALTQARQHFEVLKQEAEDRQAQRQQLFGGRTVVAVEAELAETVAHSRQTVTQQQTLQQQASHAHTQATAWLHHAQSVYDGLQARHEAAQAVLAQWLSAFAPSGLELVRLRTLLAHSADWLQAERQAAQERETAISNCQTLLTERQAALDTHLQKRTSPDSVDDVKTLLMQTQVDLDAAKTRLTTLELDLRRDDERRQQAFAVLESMAAQEAQAKVWEQLNDLIGSADGKKFRNFAQQFSLDVLLGYANRHLADLSRRYLLQRVSDSLALLVVDQDLGNESRSVHSLSGGESFLVSLALALGLASLSSHRVRVESLFIDEGFGSLDADSLRVAMDALDKLQALGRKVGVISHVQEMTERIGVQVQVKRLAGGQSRLVV